MENRAYTFAFLGVLIIICLGAYTAVSALIESSDSPIFQLGDQTPTRTSTPRPLTTVTRTPTPTETPFVPIVPTLVSPTATRTPLPPTHTPTLPPFPTPRLLPTRTSTPTPEGFELTPTIAPTPLPGAPTPTPLPATPTPRPPTATHTPLPGSFPYRVESGPVVDRSRNCTGQFYIYGFVRDNQGQVLSGVRIRFTDRTGRQPPVAVSEPKGYELTVGVADNEWFVTLIGNDDRAISPTVSVITRGLQDGQCWYRLDWRRN
jgi:hypothetical protein